MTFFGIRQPKAALSRVSGAPGKFVPTQNPQAAFATHYTASAVHRQHQKVDFFASFGFLKAVRWAASAAIALGSGGDCEVHPVSPRAINVFCGSVH